MTDGPTFDDYDFDEGDRVILDWSEGMGVESVVVGYVEGIGMSAGDVIVSVVDPDNLDFSGGKTYDAAPEWITPVPTSRRQIDTPTGFGLWLTGAPGYWPDDVPRPDRDDVRLHPQGQVYIDVEDYPASTALTILNEVESAGLRATYRANQISVWEPRPTCGREDCYADAQGGRRTHYPDLCPTHAREAHEQHLRSGGPPIR